MSTRYIHRGAQPGGTTGLEKHAPIRVDPTDNRLKMIPAGSGTTEVILQEANGSGFTPTVAVALTAAQSGMDVFLNAAEGFAITLPAVANGLRYRFIVAAAFATTNFTIVVPALATLIFGAADVNSTLVLADDENTISFVASAETLGDYAEVVSDGVNWFVSGQGFASGSITFTVAT